MGPSEKALIGAEYLSCAEFSKQKNLSKSKLERMIDQSEIPAMRGAGKGNYLIPDFGDQVPLLKEFFRGKEAFSIAFFNHKGGVSKTSNTVNIAASLAFFGYDVLVIDLDLQANASWAFGINQNRYPIVNEKNSVDLFEKYYTLASDEFEKEIDESIYAMKHPYLPREIHILASSSGAKLMLNEEMLVTRVNVHNLIDSVVSYIKQKKKYDFILIDMPPNITTIGKAGFMAADYLVACLTPDDFCVCGLSGLGLLYTAMLRPYQDRRGKKPQLLGGVMAKYSPRVSVHLANYEAVKEQFRSIFTRLTKEPVEIFEAVVSNSSRFSESQGGDSGAMLLKDPRHQSARQYLLLAHEILTVLATKESNKCQN